MPLEEDVQVALALDLTELDRDRVDDVDPLTVFLLRSPVSWPTELLSGELSALWTTLVLPWTTSLKLHMEPQEDPNLEYPPGFLEGSWTCDPSICLQVSRFLIWFQDDGCFCCFRFRFEGCCFLVLVSDASGKKVRRAMKSNPRR